MSKPVQTKRPLHLKTTLFQFSVFTTNDAEEAVSEFLEKLTGTIPCSYATPESPTTKISIYARATPGTLQAWKSATQSYLRGMRSLGISITPGRVVFGTVRKENWAESWKKHFKAMRIADRLLIKPPWSKCRPRRGAAVVILNPGLSFGTGQHATTSFCLEQIVRAQDENPHPSMLDIGTGSGILAIAAAKLGYTPVVAFDNDEEACRTASSNARRNRVDQKIRISTGDITGNFCRRSDSYSLVCANLVAPLLIQAAPNIIRFAAPGGLLVLAGILTSEFERVRRVYESAGLELKCSRTLREWRSGMFRNTTERGPLTI